MAKLKIRFIDIVYFVAIIGADIVVYVILGIFQMDYDDNEVRSRSVYWNLGGMNKWQLFYYFLLQTWNILNLLGIIFIGRKIYKRIKGFR
jgi:hypothetical protein